LAPCNSDLRCLFTTGNGSINECLKALWTCYVLPWRLPRREQFLERGSLLHVFLGLHSPTLRGKNEAFVLDDKRGLHQPLPTGFKWRRGSSALEVSSSPTLWGEMCILMKTGLHQPDPTGYKWKGFVQPFPTGIKWQRGSSALEVSSSPAPWGEMCILMKTGLPQPDPTGCKWERDFHPLRFRPA
jgi:hypothetical protein